ncbi:hypothetical protein Emed_000830 [Eimeria media]
MMDPLLLLDCHTTGISSLAPSRQVRDVVCRYAHQTGHHVERRFGWDCHGLPIEFEIDKQLGINTKQQVLEYGIQQYNEQCRSIVLRYSSQWETIVGFRNE